MTCTTATTTWRPIAFVDPTILNDPTVYPTPAIEARLYRRRKSAPALERIRTRTWTRIKTAQ